MRLRDLGKYQSKRARSTRRSWFFSARAPFALDIDKIEATYDFDIGAGKEFAMGLELKDPSGNGIRTVSGWGNSRILDLPFRYLPGGDGGTTTIISSGDLARKVTTVRIRVVAWEDGGQECPVSAFRVLGKSELSGLRASLYLIQEPKDV